MTETTKTRQTITLEALDTVAILGHGTRILEALCRYFPTLKVVARGNAIIL